MRIYYVYIVASKTRRIYIGMTSDLERRLYEHRRGIRSTFASGYNMVRLVMVEDFGRVEDAIARERQLKKWRRDKKVALIEQHNPSWKDLAKEFDI
jgi:putative endonuclease